MDRVIRGYMVPKDEEFPNPVTVVLPTEMDEANQPVIILPVTDEDVGPFTLEMAATIEDVLDGIDSWRSEEEMETAYAAVAALASLFEEQT